MGFLTAFSKTLLLVHKLCDRGWGWIGHGEANEGGDCEEEDEEVLHGKQLTD